MAAAETPLAEIGNVTRRSAAAPAEVPVVIDGYPGVAEDPDGRDVIAHVAEGLAGFAPPQAENVAAEIAVTIKTGPATPPIAAMPVAARRPIAFGFGFPPATARSTVAFGPARSLIAPDNENGTTSAFHPKTLTVNAPRLSNNAGPT